MLSVNLLYIMCFFLDYLPSYFEQKPSNHQNITLAKCSVFIHTTFSSVNILAKHIQRVKIRASNPFNHQRISMFDKHNNLQVAI